MLVEDNICNFFCMGIFSINNIVINNKLEDGDF